MWRLHFLVKRCYELREPVLLVGETGGGKTTVCQLLSIDMGLKLHILNCHQYTETSDFLGVGYFLWFIHVCFLFLLQYLLKILWKYLIFFEVTTYDCFIGFLSYSREVKTCCKI